MKKPVRGKAAKNKTPKEIYSKPTQPKAKPMPGKKMVAAC